MIDRAAAVRRNAAFRVGGQVLERLLRGLCVVPFLGRFLGPGAYGSYSAAVALVYLFRPLVGGVLPVLTAEIVRRPADEDALLRGTIRSATRVALIAWPLCVLVTHALYRDEPLTLAVAAAGAVLVADACSLHAAAWSARLREGRIVAANVVGLVVFVTGVLTCWRLHSNFVALVIVWAAAEVVQSIALWRMRPRRPSSGAPGRSILATSIPAVLVAVLGIACGSIDIVLVARLAPAAEAGSYAAVFRLMSVAWLLPNALSQAMVPLLARHDDARRACLRGVVWLAAAALPLAFFAGLFAPAASFVFGPAFAAAASFVPFCAARLAVAFVAAPLRTYLLARNRQRAALTGELIMLAILIAGCCIFVPRVGAAGAAAAAVVGELARLAFLLRQMESPFFTSLAARLWRPAVQCAVSAVPGYLTPAPWPLRTAVALVGYAALRAWSAR